MTFLMHAAATGLGSGVPHPASWGPEEHSAEPLLDLSPTPDLEKAVDADGEDRCANGHVEAGADAGEDAEDSPDPWVPCVKLAIRYARENTFLQEVRAP